jgi:hypothetical protein
VLGTTKSRKEVLVSDKSTGSIDGVRRPWGVYGIVWGVAGTSNLNSLLSRGKLHGGRTFGVYE